MKLTKRLVAVALAILMIFGSVSVAMTASAADGTTLGITTKILRNVNGVWTETSKVKAGEDVKLGVYLDTDFYAGDGEILLFYDNTFFEPVSTGNNKTLTVGSSYGAGSSYDIIGGKSAYYHIGPGSQAATYSQAMVTNSKIDSAYASTHDPLYIAFEFGQNAETQPFDGNKLFCEIPFKVKTDAPTAKTGAVEAKEETACSPSFRRGRINVSKGGEGVIPSNADNMWNWEATLDFNAEPVSLYANCTAATFDANYGKFEVAASKYVSSLYSEGEAGENIENLIGKDNSDKAYVVETFAEPTRDGYNFVGWKVEGTDDSTATMVNVYPDSDTKYVAVWEKEDVSSADKLNFRTEIYREDENGEWVKTDKVMPGENVKARLFIDTEYRAGNGEIIMFYDGDFFEDSYNYDNKQSLDLNFDSATSAPSLYGLTGNMYKPSYLNTTIADLIDCGYIDIQYLNDHPALIATYEFPYTSECQVISGDEWFLQFDLKVKDSEKLADTIGDFYIIERTVANTTDGMWAFVNISKEAENDSLAMNADSMFLWDADVTIESNPVSIYNTIRFDANGGEFAAENTETYTIDGTVGAKVDYSTIPEVSREGYTFMGWIDASDDTPTLEEAKFADALEATMTHNSIIEGSDPAAAIIYNAFWVSNVNITFANINPETGAVEEIETINVTSGDPFVAPADPSLDGYRFMGWTYDYKDGKIGAITGLHENYPSESTTYYAIYSALQYPVNYYVLDADIENPTMDDFKLVAQSKTEYGAVISAVPHTYTVPEGYAISVAYDEVLYGEEIMFIEAGKFVAGTTMPASEYNLYFKIERAEFDAIFNANEGAWADGETTKTVKAVFDEEIAVPEAPVREGYEFAGWEPAVTIMDEEGKTFNATWTPATFIATYHIDSESYPYDVEFGDEMQSPADPYKVGYNFLGWAEEEGSTTVVELPETMPAKNVDYYAVFEAIEYTITFANTGDEAMEAITLPYGTEVGEIAEPTKTGYTFAGWTWTKAADSTAVEAPATMPAYDTVATAEWTINQYTVTWIVDGSETVNTYDYLAPVVKAEDPVKTGYTFKGWTPEFPADGLAMPAEDLTYTAVFEANTYDAVFNTVVDGETHDGAFADGTTSLAVPTVFGEEIVAPAEEPVRTGYTFAGWDPIVGSMDEEGKTYTAVWTPNANTQYTVEFWSMLTTGEYELTDTQYFTGESDSVIKLVVSSPKNYTINKDESTYDNDVTIAPDGSTVVTVYFDLPLFTITFVGNEGTVDGEPEVSSELRYGAQVSVPATEREGYTFKGWFDAAEGGNALDVNLTAIEPVTYYAQWEINQYTITFDTVGGTEIPAKTQDYGTAVEAPADPTKLGHTFAGWDVEVPTTMPAEDMTITAQWTVNSYDAIFNAGEGKFADGSATATTEDVVFGEEITAPAENPSREGYDFIGWSTDGETVLTPVGIMDAEGKEFKAVWEINQYTITFADTGDTVIAPITQDYATAVTAPADPEKEGYTFTGWDVAVPATMPAEDITITAQWTVNQYDATFDANTGAWADSDVIKTVPTNYGEAIVAPAEEPVKAGYKFLGWFDAKENGYSVDTYTSMPELADGETITFYARWEAMKNEYTIHIFEMQPNGEWPEEPTSMVINNALVGETVEANIKVPAGFTLNTTKSVLEGVVPETGELVLEVYLERAPHTFTAIVDGVALVDGVEYYFDETVKAIDTPTRDGYTFAGWTETAPGGIVEEGAAADASYPARMPNNDVTIYGVWSTNSYNAIFDAGKGTFESTNLPTETVPVKFGETVTAPTEVPVQEGFEFGGWKAEDGTVYQPGDEIADAMTSAGAKFEAVWNKSVFTVTFYGYEALAESPYKSANATEILDSKTYDFNDAIEFPADPTNIDAQYYTFLGWSKTEGGAVMSDAELYNQKMPAEDIAYYAVYERVKVMLIPNDDANYWVANDKTCTTVIDRTGDNWYVYGLTEKMLTETPVEKKSLKTYVDVQGDGYYEVVDFKAKEDSVGTGTVINVYDNVTGELVETFTIIIYGDINGDGGITNTDYTLAWAEAFGSTEWSAAYSDDYCHYKAKAANINGDNVFSSVDATQINFYVLGNVDIDQAAGCVTDPPSAVG